MNRNDYVLEPLDDDYLQFLRSLSLQQRLDAVNALWRIASDTTRSILREQHPKWSASRLQWEVAREMSHGEVEQVPPEFRPVGWNDGD